MISTHLEQQLEQGVRLLLSQTNDPLGKPGVDKESLLSSGGMDPDDGVFRLDGGPSDKVAVALGTFGLWEAAVLGTQALEEGLDGLGETCVGCCLRGPACVASCLWDGEEGQDGDSGGLALVGHVGVVSYCGEFVAPVAVAVLVVGAEVDVVEFQVVFDVGADGLEV